MEILAIVFLVILIGATWLALSVGATLVAAMATLHPVSNRLMLTAVAWVLPIFGALVAFYLLRDKARVHPPRSGAPDEAQQLG